MPSNSLTRQAGSSLRGSVRWNGSRRSEDWNLPPLACRKWIVCGTTRKQPVRGEQQLVSGTPLERSKTTPKCSIANKQISLCDHDHPRCTEIPNMLPVCGHKMKKNCLQSVSAM